MRLEIRWTWKVFVKAKESCFCGDWTKAAVVPSYKVKETKMFVRFTEE